MKLFGLACCSYQLDNGVLYLCLLDCRSVDNNRRNVHRSDEERRPGGEGPLRLPGGCEQGDLHRRRLVELHLQQGVLSQKEYSK